jgi:hypothetical protein
MRMHLLTGALSLALHATISPPALRPRAGTIVATASGYDTSRAVNIVKELGARAAGLSVVGPGGNSALKSEILGLLAPFGDPALGVTDETFDAVDAACRKLERSNPTAASNCVPALEGAWRVRYSNAPPPSNGALGPLRGRAYQVIDADAATYSNELSLFGNLIQLKLKATFEQRVSSEAALRVAFRSITIFLAGVALPAIEFPAGTERTWLLTYTCVHGMPARANYLSPPASLASPLHTT